MKTPLVTLLISYFLTLSPSLLAQEKGAQTHWVGDLERTAVTHLVAFLTGDGGVLKRSYHEEVTLLVGHEFLDDEYSLSELSNQNTMTVPRAALIEEIVKTVEEEGSMPLGAIDHFLKEISIQSLSALMQKKRSGPFSVFEIKFQPQNDDWVIVFEHEKRPTIMAIHLRRIDEEWRVIGEYYP